MSKHLISQENMNTLRGLYRQSHRHYHTWEHVEALLAWFQEYRSDLHDRDAVELAVHYHDAIYDPQSKTNEDASAALMVSELDGQVDEAVLQSAATLILATDGHALPAKGRPKLLSDCAFFLDMDLSILGAPPAAFDRYEDAIRKEYYFVPAVDYRKGRSTILEDFLARERLYFTEPFHTRLDNRARKNLKRSLTSLAEP